MTNNRQSGATIVQKRRAQAAPQRDDDLVVNDELDLLITERLYALNEARKHVPGKNEVCLRTMWRWSLKGKNGVRLPTLEIAGERYTSAEAIRRFLVASNRAKSARREREHRSGDQVLGLLDQEGI